MTRNEFVAVIAIIFPCFVASSLNAATIPAGTNLTVPTVSSISSTDPVGRIFEAQIDRDVVVKGKVLLNVEPGSSPRTARQAQYGHTAGTLLVSPGTKMQFQLLQAATF
jgi:hypothetical protein